MMCEAKDIFCPEGVADPTAAEAIVKTLPTPKPGEVWTDTVKGKLRLIVSTTPVMSTCLTLNEVERKHNIPVVVEGVEMFTMPGMFFMLNARDYGEKVGALFPEEFEAVKAAVAAELGLDNAAINADRGEALMDLTNECNQLEARLRAADDLLGRREAEIEDLKRLHTNLRIDLEDAYRDNAELEKKLQDGMMAPVYKELYEKLLDRVLAKGGF